GGAVRGSVFWGGPQTGGRVGGGDACVRLGGGGCPGAWHIPGGGAVGRGQRAAGWVGWRPAGNDTQSGLSFFDLGDDGRITRITDFWPEPYEPPADRAHLVERY